MNRQWLTTCSHIKLGDEAQIDNGKAYCAKCYKKLFPHWEEK